MAYTTGRCINDLYCAAASARQDLQVPAGSQFVCPQCGKALITPPTEKPGISRPVLIACGGLVLAGSFLFAAGAMIGSRPAVHVAAPMPKVAAGSFAPEPERVTGTMKSPVSPRSDSSAPPPPTAKPESTAEIASPAISRPPIVASRGQTSLSQPNALATPAVAVLPASLHSVAATQPATAPTLRLAMLQTPAKETSLSDMHAPPPAPTAIPAPPPSQAAQTQASQQGLTRLQAQGDLVRQARAADQARHTQATLLAAQQQKTAALLAQELRRKNELVREQVAADALAKQQDEANSAAQAAQVAAAARQKGDAQAKRLAATAPPPRGPTRDFSAAPISGGAPAYPQIYESEGRAGRVTVSCQIAQSGSPSLCHVLAAHGGVGFSNAVLSWLRSGNVRFSPVLRNGQPQDGEHSWTMGFEP